MAVITSHGYSVIVLTNRGSSTEMAPGQHTVRIGDAMVSTKNKQMAIAKWVKLTGMTVVSAAFAPKIKMGLLEGFSSYVREEGHSVDLFVKCVYICAAGQLILREKKMVLGAWRHPSVSCHMLCIWVLAKRREIA